MTIKYFTFNDFQEITYIIYDKTNECIIIDPGCYYPEEEKKLKDFIEDQNLIPKRLICTHFHLDHVLGNQFVSKIWNLPFEGPKEDIYLLEHGKQSAKIYGFNNYKGYSEPKFIKNGDVITFGNTTLETIHIPGHTPGHLAFIEKTSKSIFSGDVLFKNSIGRTDLPGGDFETIKKSIQNKLYSYPDDFIIYCGHGIFTNIGIEKTTNPFVKA